MGRTATTVCGMLLGLNVFLACAIVGVIAANGADNPGLAGIPPGEASAAAGGSAEAPEPAPRPGSLPALDLDGDGRISLAEAAGHAQIVSRFERADRDRDGRLTRTEFERLSKLPPPKAGKSKSGKKDSRRPETTAPVGG